MTTNIELTPVATVVGGRSEATDDHWAGVQADIVLEDRFPLMLFSASTSSPTSTSSTCSTESRKRAS